MFHLPQLYITGRPIVGLFGFFRLERVRNGRRGWGRNRRWFRQGRLFAIIVCISADCSGPIRQYCGKIGFGFPANSVDVIAQAQFIVGLRTQLGKSIAAVVAVGVGRSVKISGANTQIELQRFAIPGHIAVIEKYDKSIS